MKTSEEMLASNPGLKRLFNQLLDERIRQATSQGESSGSTLLTTLTPTKQHAGESVHVQRNKIIKSPSDTTVYAPALVLKRGGTDLCGGGQNFPVNSKIGVKDNLVADLTKQVGQTVIENHVANFVEGVRAANSSPHAEEQSGRTMRRSSQISVPGLEDAKERADKAVLEAKKFRAAIAEQPGRTFVEVENPFNMQPLMLNPQVDANVHLTSTGISNDDFFHLISHIDMALKGKIENGEFVDLDKLLPKERGNPMFSCSDFERLEWVRNDSGTFLVPAKKQSRINSFRHWEQAFRIYATIYCGAHPHRAREIWQYISVINIAANAYVWDNVYSYDITFRQLMQFNPTRSWAITYNHMWNLSMREPLPNRNFGRGGNLGGFTSRNPNVIVAGPAKKKTDYCWNFNKGVKCRFGSKCKFVERCSYCDSSSHSVHACNKLDNKKDGDHRKHGKNEKKE